MIYLPSKSNNATLQRLFSIIIVFVHLFCVEIFADNEKIRKTEGWSLLVYNAIMTEAEIERTLEKLSDIDDSYKFSAIGAGKKLCSLTRRIDLEYEGHIVGHWAGQHHFELNNLILLRWLSFPWDHILDTSFAIGDGLSYATRSPEFEERLDGRATKLLNFIIWEISFTHPKSEHLSLLFRVHHRSGVFGIFSNISGGSNALGLGVRYKF